MAELLRPTTFSELERTERGWSRGGARAFIVTLCLFIFVFAGNLVLNRTWILSCLCIAMAILRFVAACCDQTYPLIPALARNYTNPNYPEQEFWFLFKYWMLQGAVFGTIGAEIVVVAICTTIGVQDPTVLGRVVTAVGISTAIFGPILVWAAQSFAPLKREWDVYLAARDSV